MKKAIVITARNEGHWTKRTAENFSLHFPDAHIIGVDDGGKNIWPSNVEVIKTDGAVGVGRCRLLGVEHAKADVVLISDGHVFYEYGDIDKAWQLAYEGNVVNSTTMSYKTKRKHGNGRAHILPSHKCQNVFAKEGDEVGLIGGVYFMRKDVAKEVIAPTPSHGFNEQIMTSAALAFGHRIYCYPDFCFSHLYKKEFNYAITSVNQSRNRRLLEWWFFGGQPVDSPNIKELNYYRFIKKRRVLSPFDLKKRILAMNTKLKAK